jgi:hypothetical protein
MTKDKWLLAGLSYTTGRHKEGPVEVGFSPRRRLDSVPHRSSILPMVNQGSRPALTELELSNVSPKSLSPKSPGR